MSGTTPMPTTAASHATGAPSASVTAATRPSPLKPVTWAVSLKVTPWRVCRSWKWAEIGADTVRTMGRSAASSTVTAQPASAAAAATSRPM